MSHVNKQTNPKPDKKANFNQTNILPIEIDRTTIAESKVRADVVNLSKLIKTLSSPTSKRPIMLDALRRIRHITALRDNSVLQQIVLAQGVQTIVKLINTPTLVDATIVFEATAILSRIVIVIHNVAPLLITMGIVPTLIKYIPQENVPPELKREILCLLALMTSKSPSVRDDLLQLDVLAAICKFSSHPMPLQLLKALSTTIRWFSDPFDGKHPAPFPSFMKTSLPVIQGLLAFDDTDVVSDAVIALHHLVQRNDRDIQKDQINLLFSLLEPTTLSALVNICDTTSNDDIRFRVTVILLFLCEYNPLTVFDLLLATPFVPTLLKLLKSSTISPHIRNAAGYLLSQIIKSNETNAIKLIEWGVYTELFHLVNKQHSSGDTKPDVQLFLSIVFAVRHLNITLLNHIKSIGWIPTLVSHLKRDNPCDVIEQSIIALYFFLVYGASHPEEHTTDVETTSVFVEIIKEAGIVELASDLLNHSDKNIKEHATIILTNYYDFIIESDSD